MLGVHWFIHSQVSKVQHHACTHSFSPYASMSSYILSIHKRYLLRHQASKTRGKVCFARSGLLAALFSYTDPPQGDSHEKTHRVWMWIWQGGKSSQLTSLRRTFKNVKPPNQMLSNIQTDNWWSCENTKVYQDTGSSSPMREQMATMTSSLQEVFS